MILRCRMVEIADELIANPEEFIKLFILGSQMSIEIEDTSENYKIIEKAGLLKYFKKVEQVMPRKFEIIGDGSGSMVINSTDPELKLTVVDNGEIVQSGPLHE